MFLVERYFVARRIWPMRAMRAHEGFPATETRSEVPPQTWAEWFEWAFGMPLAEYAALAKENDHAALAQRMADDAGVPLFDYLLGDRWLTVLGSPGDTLETVSAVVRRQFPDVKEIREHR